MQSLTSRKAEAKDVGVEKGEEKGGANTRQKASRLNMRLRKSKLRTLMRTLKFPKSREG